MIAATTSKRAPIRKTLLFMRLVVVVGHQTPLVSQDTILAKSNGSSGVASVHSGAESGSTRLVKFRPRSAAVLGCEFPGRPAPGSWRRDAAGSRRRDACATGCRFMERILRKEISRFEPLNLVAANVRRRKSLIATRVRLLTPAATKRRFMGREGARWGTFPSGAGARKRSYLATKPTILLRCTGP
jgi:hypothetical protein